MDIFVNLIDLLRSELGGQVASKLATAIGEQPEPTRLAVYSLVPAVISALVSKMSSPSGTNELLGLIPQTDLVGTTAASPASLLESSGTTDLLNVGGPLVAALFGSRLSAVSDWLASSAGIGSRSSSSLISMVVPLIMSLVVKQASRAGGLNTSSLANIVSGQSTFLSPAMPAGLWAAVGVQGFDRPNVDRPSVAAPPAAHASSSNVPKWLLPVLAVIAIVWGLPSCRTEPTPPVASETPSSATAPTEAPAASITSCYGIDLGALVGRLLPGGTALTIPEKGVEATRAPT